LRRASVILNCRYRLPFINSFVKRPRGGLAVTFRTYRDLSNEVIAAAPRLILVAFP